jgi:hypothetical protein
LRLPSMAFCIFISCHFSLCSHSFNRIRFSFCFLSLLFLLCSRFSYLDFVI